MSACLLPDGLFYSFYYSHTNKDKDFLIFIFNIYSKKKKQIMKHLNKFNEAEIPNPHAWRNNPAPEKEINILDMVRGGDIDALEDFLHANEADLKRNVTRAVKFSAPGTRNENPTIYDYVMDTYSDLVDMEDVDKWLKYDRKKPEASRRDIDEQGRDWYGFDHPEDLGESFKHIKTFEGFTK